MDHPLLSADQAALRRRLVHFLKTALSVQRSSNIIFLCGGTNSNDLRMTFKEYCQNHLQEYQIFLPEAAMTPLFSDDLQEPFDLTDFEVLVGRISLAIVLFPEAAGSYAETGYFSAIPALAQKCILVLDRKYQSDDSFLSLGPAKKISEQSIFHPNITLDYCQPDFETITTRLRSRKLSKKRKSLQIDKFSDLSEYEIIVVLDMIVRLCKIATLSDINYLLAAIFKNRFSQSKIQKLLSILVGSNYLQEIGPYGHFTSGNDKLSLAIVREGFKNDEQELRLSLTTICQKAEPDFVNLIRAPTYVD